MGEELHGNVSCLTAWLLDSRLSDTLDLRVPDKVYTVVPADGM